MGKPKCTDALIVEAVKLKKNGMSNKDMAAVLCIDERTLYMWLNEPKSDKQRQLGQSLKNAEAEYKAALRSRIQKASESDWKASAWMLERQYPDEYSRRVIDANVRGSVEVKAITAEARAEMDKLLGLE